MAMASHGARYLIWAEINLSLSLSAARLPSNPVSAPSGREYGAFQALSPFRHTEDFFHFGTIHIIQGAALT